MFNLNVERNDALVICLQVEATVCLGLEAPLAGLADQIIANADDHFLSELEAEIDRLKEKFANNPLERNLLVGSIESLQDE